MSPDGQPQHQVDPLALAAGSSTAASLGAGLASDHGLLGALVQKGCVELKARKLVGTEIRCRGSQRSFWLGTVPGSPVPREGGQRGTLAPRAQDPLEAVAEIWVSAGWECNHGSRSFCIATWLGDT